MYFVTGRLCQQGSMSLSEQMVLIQKIPATKDTTNLLVIAFIQVLSPYFESWILLIDSIFNNIFNKFLKSKT